MREQNRGSGEVSKMSDPGYPAGTDPNKYPLVEQTGNKAVYDVTVTVSVIATCEDSAMLMVGDELSKIGDVEKLSEWVENV